ncbi:hypothetical protein ACFSQ7_14485 [Paenibacillus rhizoplanae]
MFAFTFLALRMLLMFSSIAKKSSSSAAPPCRSICGTVRGPLPITSRVKVCGGAD